MILSETHRPPPRPRRYRYRRRRLSFWSARGHPAQVHIPQRGPWNGDAVDGPFLFLVRHRPTGVVLLIGQITDPDPATTAEKNVCDDRGPYERRPHLRRLRRPRRARSSNLNLIQVVGGLSQKQVTAVIDPQRNALYRCVAKGHRATPRLRSRVKARITIQRNGTVKDPEVIFMGGPPHATTRSCLEGILRGLRFPKNDREVTLVAINPTLDVGQHVRSATARWPRSRRYR